MPGLGPRWSPDGTQITYWTQSEIVTNELEHVRVIAVDGASRSRTLADGATPDWSPDGGRLVFVVPTADTLAIVGVDGGGHAVIPNTRAAMAGGPIQPVWSPDGSRIAFAMQDAALSSGTASGVTIDYSLRTIAPDGSDPRTLFAEHTSALGLGGARWTSGAPAGASSCPTDPSEQGQGDAGGGGGSGPHACSHRLRGSRHADTLIGTAGADVIRGLRGDDRIRSRAGADCLYGGAGDDRLDGGAGPDRLRGDAGRDRLKGGSGPDTILARDHEKDLISCGPGRDTVTADRIDRVRPGCEKVKRRG